MIYLTVPEIIQLHAIVLQKTGGSTGTRDFGALESALAQPRMTLDNSRERNLFSG